MKSSNKVYSSREFIRVIEDNGFKHIRNSASHMIYKRGPGETIVLNKKINRMIAERLIKTYRLKIRGETIMKKTVLLISGSSGVGKTTLVHNLKRMYPELNLELIPSYTTRALRKNERNGMDYIFVDMNAYFVIKKQKMFIESTQYNDEYYASNGFDGMKVLLAGKTPIYVTTTSGLSEIKDYFKNISPDICVKSVYLMADPQTEFERLLSRASESHEGVLRRSYRSFTEVDNAIWYDHVCWADLSPTELALKVGKMIIGDCPMTRSEKYKKICEYRHQFLKLEIF